ncbi:hypothetical protein B0H65DRAFT_446700 [Neurospora tetraspora]|uniref:Uncharacterized protein n=1 Tax=Neurospora tetraspora TaxID=94610 RepID=A0AAE0J148_9PEZI|nr:hypothetical protein B0H65DRAFT_446700 [Neurospora tetraspora]
MTMDTPDQAKIRAERACTSPLWVNGVPQIIIFCDRSRKWVVLRNPWANNVDNVDNQERAAAGSAAAPMPFGFTSQSGFGVRSWSYKKVYSAAHVESGALAQSLDVALQLVEHHRPEPAIIELFTDSQECWHRIDRGLHHKAWRFSVKHISPIMRAIVWMSYHLKELGGELKVHWNPRRRYKDDHQQAINRRKSPRVGGSGGDSQETNYASQTSSQAKRRKTKKVSFKSKNVIRDSEEPTNDENDNEEDD